MKNKIKKILIASLLLISSMVFAQEGTVSGILSDDSGAIPGVSIFIKGTTNGTETDFDGKYSIQCKVGDVLVFSYLGYATKEQVVTNEMFGVASGNKVPYISVKLVHSNAYSKAVEAIKKITNPTPNIGNTKTTYNKSNGYFQYNRIKDIEVKKDKVKLTYFSPDIFYEVGYNSSFGVQFIRQKNAPELQNSFSQGISISGILNFQGPETGNIFSYGPALNTLEFDGNNYIYDQNGSLINQGNGNGNPANSYDNSLFENVLNYSNQVFFNVSTDAELFGLDILNEGTKDIYNRERNNTNKVTLNYVKKKRNKRLGWKAFINYQATKDNQPNINGFQNNLLLNLWATPPSFRNNQGDVLPNNTQRSFSSQFNNSEWLLNYNNNSIKDNSFVTSLQNNINISDDITLESKFSYTHDDQQQKFGLVTGTSGFQNGFSSEKGIKRNRLNSVIHFDYNKYKDDNEITVKSVVNYSYDNLDFSLQESMDFQPFSFVNLQNTTQLNESKSRSTLRVLNQFKYELNNTWEFQFTNNSYFSSIQNDKFFLPSLYVRMDFLELLDIYDFHKFSISSNISFDVNDSPLYYNNLSHNSLLLTPQESLSYTSNNDLFINSLIGLEEKENYEVNASLGFYLLEGNTDIDFTYYNTKTKGSVFPVISNGAFQLDNVADIRNTGFEFSIDSNIRIADDFYYDQKISFSSFRNKVLNLVNDESRIPIAGFSTTSKNLIVGQPAGVIVGSAYLRDEQNNMVIGNDGFPLIDPTPQIIGNPVPNFNIGISSSFKWKKLALNIVLDIQKGGDVWNGTQNVLNYLGTSQQSAIERGTTNFIFNGVNQQGNTNNIPVDFYDPNNPISENRFVRYGFEGIGEEAIVDGSYMNVKSIDITYSFFKDDDKKYFLRECKLGLYAKNILTWSKFRGRTPYSSLYGNASGQELNFFNMPLFSEVGFTLKIKI